MSSSDQRAAKRAIRQHVIAARAALDESDRRVRGEQLAARAGRLVAAAGTDTVSAYVSTGGEPDTIELIDSLTRSGVRVLLPLLCEDFDLEWAVYEPGRLVEARFGILQPTGASLGKEAIAEAGVVFCPGVSGTERGERLGRGGGSYDRSLSRSDPAAHRCLLLYDDEVVGAVPVEPHDELVDYLCTPSRLIEASPGRLQHQGVVGR